MIGSRAPTSISGSPTELTVATDRTRSSPDAEDPRLFDRAAALPGATGGYRRDRPPGSRTRRSTTCAGCPDMVPADRFDGVRVTRVEPHVPTSRGPLLHHPPRVRVGERSIAAPRAALPALTEADDDDRISGPQPRLAPLAPAQRTTCRTRAARDGCDRSGDRVVARTDPGQLVAVQGLLDADGGLGAAHS